MAPSYSIHKFLRPQYLTSNRGPTRFFDFVFWYQYSRKINLQIHKCTIMLNQENEVVHTEKLIRQGPSQGGINKDQYIGRQS